jgi:hypothetical protein
VADPIALLADVSITHPRMTIAIGQPAVLHPGEAYPVVHVMPHVPMTLTGEVVAQGTHTIATVTALELSAGCEQAIQLPGTADRPGEHRLQICLVPTGRPPLYDSFAFTVMDGRHVRPGQSRLAYIDDETGSMAYVPDYKGNRLLDFSNCGYMGAGVTLPAVQARVAVEPGDGDAAARIQAAIDLVSSMPQDAEGIRGAVLLKRGLYHVGTTLHIRASGVVLRGEGQGEDGTILCATGNVPRRVLEIGGSAGPRLLGGGTVISDLFVPVGARTFHVEDAGSFKIGDKVIVRRHGNDRWIHAIGMDRIVNRPGSPPGTTQQWSPFDLDFDRIIAHIDGNIVTVDAPLANSIERRWGGGEVIAYDDPDRIEQVGVEHLRVDVVVDPRVTAVHQGATYCADENHAATFAAFDNVTNAWVRDVTTRHLAQSLADVMRHAKWVTVQDSSAIDMVSLIQGGPGRRYNFAVAGQLSLVQRCHAETARHAFVVDAIVPGPNVFLDSRSVNEFATSEPHHRWSTGGLYDNIRAAIAIQDRAWLGTGHGWAGANYVAWNTEGPLVVQQPPTAQNYAIGHVGEKVRPRAPNSYDPRPRRDGYWECQGQHVSPRSLYVQQLQDRLGPQSLRNIAKTTVGGGALDVPAIRSGFPALTGVTIDGQPLAGFSPMTFEYTVQLPAGTTALPSVKARDADYQDYQIETLAAISPNGKAVLIVRSLADPGNAARYTVRFCVETVRVETS